MRASSNPVAALTLGALRAHGATRLKRYDQALASAIADEPPPFGMAWYGERYRELAGDPSWLAQSLVSNAVKEGEGSRKLWDLAGRCADVRISSLIKAHAIDESRHARYYLAMLGITFPGAADGRLMLDLRKLSPGYRPADRLVRGRTLETEIVLDDLIQMNIGEIRTRINQLLLRPVILAHCLPTNRQRLSRILDRLLLDETRHIEYTASLIDAALDGRRRGFVQHYIRLRLADFNAITLDEVGGERFDGA